MLKAEFPGGCLKVNGNEDTMTTGNFEIRDEKGALLHSKKGGAGVCRTDAEINALCEKIRELFKERGLKIPERDAAAADKAKQDKGCFIL